MTWPDVKLIPQTHHAMSLVFPLMPSRSMFNPLDPNLAISAHAVFPPSGHIRPEKQLFFQDFPHFSKLESVKMYYPLTGLQYIKLKPVKFPLNAKEMCVGETYMDSCSKFWGNLEEIWGNPAEILHIGWKIPGSILGLNSPCGHVEFKG